MTERESIGPRERGREKEGERERQRKIVGNTPYDDVHIGLNNIIIKVGYNARCHWLKERAL